MVHSWPDRVLFAEAMLRLAAARLLLLLFPFRTIARRLARGRNAAVPEASRLHGQPVGSDDEPVLRRIRWALAAASRRAPWRCQCLEQSIAGKLMLRARGIPNTLYLGFAKSGQSAAHAWLRSGTFDVTESEVTEGEEGGRFAVVTSFTDDR
jgi:hypothetical protein